MQQFDTAVTANERVHSTGLIQEPQMCTLRFGRKLSLPSTIAIKHQVRMLMRHEVKKGEAEVVREQPSLAVPVTEVSTNILSDGIRLL
jgi:hypothetical protein